MLLKRVEQNIIDLPCMVAFQIYLHRYVKKLERIILTSKLYSRLALKLLSEYFWKNPCGLITYTFWIVAVNKICKSGAKQITIVCAFVQIALETVLYNTHNNMKIYHQGKTIKILTFNLFRTSFTAAHFSERRSMMAVNPFFRSSGL